MKEYNKYIQLRILKEYGDPSGFLKDLKILHYSFYSDNYSCKNAINIKALINLITLVKNNVITYHYVSANSPKFVVRILNHLEIFAHRLYSIFTEFERDLYRSFFNIAKLLVVVYNKKKMKDKILIDLR